MSTVLRYLLGTACLGAGGLSAFGAGAAALGHVATGDPVVSLPVIALGGVSAALMGLSADMFGWVKRGSETAPMTLARSVWATRDRLQKILRRLGNGGEGIYLGLFRDEKGTDELRYDGTKHVLVFGAPGANKSMGIAVPNLAHLGRSMIVLDVKGQLSAIALRRRAKLGKVIVLNPFGIFIEALPYLESAGWNPMLQLDPNSFDFEDGARCLADALIEKGDGQGNSRFFDEGGLNILTAFIMWERLKHGDAAHLSNVRKMLCEPTVYVERTKTPKSGFLHTVMDMTRSGNLSLVNIGSRLLTRLTDENAKTTSVEDVTETVLTQTRLLDTPAMFDDLSSGGAIDFGAFHREVVTVFVIIPADQLDGPCVKWLRMFVNMALHQLYKSPRPTKGRLPPVLFMLDEFANLGRLAEISRALTISRDYGIQLMMFLHHIGQLKKHYPHDDWLGFFTGSGAITAFRTGDAETPDYLCKLYGTREEYVPTLNPTGGTSTTLQAVPLIRPEDVGRLGHGETISLIEPCAMPIKGNAPVYPKTPYASGLDPNPYYGG